MITAILVSMDVDFIDRLCHYEGVPFVIFNISMI